MTAPTGTTIAPEQGKDTTRSSAGGKSKAKTYSKGIPKVSNNLARRPRKANTPTLPSSILILSEPDGASYQREGGTSKKSSAKKRAMKQVMREKKGRKKKARQAQKEEEDSLIDSFVHEDGDDQFIAACALTNMLKRKKKKAPMKGGEASRHPTPVEMRTTRSRSL